MMTTSPLRGVGRLAQNAGHIARKTSKSVAPLDARLAFPRGARQRRHVTLVLAPDSSRKISPAGSKPSWRRRHARRPRDVGTILLAGSQGLFLYVSHLLQRIVHGGRLGFHRHGRAQFF
jgi:hypothetical protein